MATGYCWLILMASDQYIYISTMKTEVANYLET
jgi:hypothetical protein